MIGPVQEKETSTSVNAIKNIPRKLLVPAFESDLFVHDDGKEISKAPKNENPNTRNNAKKIKLAIQLVARLFNAAGPNSNVIENPSKVKIVTIEIA